MMRKHILINTLLCMCHSRTWKMISVLHASVFSFQCCSHRLTNSIDTKAKCRHRYSQYDGISYPSSLPISPSLWLAPPPPFPVWISILYTRIQCERGGGYGVLGLRQVNTCREVPLQVNFIDDDILHCLLRVLSFYGCSKTRILLSAEISS